MRIVKCEQHSFEWFAARTGRLTASRICDVMATLKNGGEAAARRNYRTELLCERLTSKPADHFVSKEMAWGTDQEPFARTEYEIATGNDTEQIGFVLHPRLDYSGSSPDSLVDDEGLLEIKAPTTANHLTWMVDGVVPEQHRDQCQWNMACTERKWTDFVSFDSRLPQKLQLFIKRLERDDKRIAEIEREVIKLHAEVEYLIAQLGVEGQLPPIEAFCEKRTVRIGVVDVPADIVDLIDKAEMIP